MAPDEDDTPDPRCVDDPGFLGPWKTFLEAKGYKVLAPSWPYQDRPVKELQASSAPELASVGVAEILAHYETIVRAQPELPILIGHSFGGLFVQMLLDRGLGVAGVAIDPAPPKGVFPSVNALKAAFPVVSTWNAQNKVITLPFADFAWGWVHNLPEAEQRRIYQEFCVPTPGKPYMQGAVAPFTSTMAIQFGNPKRPPLLLFAGEEDRTVTADMVRAAYALQARSPSPTKLISIPGRTHWIVGQDGWEEVATMSLDWLRELGVA